MAYKPKVLTVSEGGSGAASLTAFGLLCGGTTSTSAIQSPALGNAGDVYTSAGSSALGSFQPFSGGTSKGMVWELNTTGTLAPANAKTYILCTGLAATVTNGLPVTFFYSPVSCTIKNVYGAATATGSATSQNSTLSIRVNGSTSTNVTTTLLFNSSSVPFSNTSLSISLSAGDYFEVLLVTPTWVTAPTTIGLVMTIQGN